MKVAALYPNASWEIKDIDALDSKTLQEIVGGYIELVQADTQKFCVYVNETGILDRLRNNLFAMHILDEFGFAFCPAGPVVLVQVDDDYSDIPLTADSLARIQKKVDEWNSRPENN
jgi:hypothetical protein